jgi:uncharacterized protein YbjT (DUF2867 family)
MSTILVTGSTGKIGRQVIEQLGAKPNVTIRAAVHTPRSAEQIAATGATPVPFDWDDPSTYGPAVAGVDALFLLSPMVPDLARQLAALLEVARKAGVRRVVRSSAAGADPKSPILLGRWHGEADDVVRAAPIPSTIVRPGNFMQNFIYVYPPDAEGNIYLPWGDAKVNFVDTHDIAAVIVATLIEQGHEGKTYDVTGPGGISATEAAEAISKASGRKVRYVDVPESAAQQAMKDAGMPDVLVQAMTELNAACKAGYLGTVAPTVRTVTGREPKTFAEFARENAASWRVA